MGDKKSWFFLVRILLICLVGICFTSSLFAQVDHQMLGQVVEDRTEEACTYDPNGIEAVNLYSTLETGKPLLIFISGMS